MPMDFYYNNKSSPCRAVHLTIAAIGIPVNLKEIDLMKAEQLKPEFKKINPQHVIPTIDDNGFHLWESRAIMMYLVDQYAKNDSLYPKDVKKRAVVNQRLFFDACSLYESFANCYYPMLFQKGPLNPEKQEKIETNLSHLDNFLQGEEYVAGKNMTIADLALLATVTTLEAVDFDLSKFQNVTRWLAKMKKTAPNYEEANKVGAEGFKALAKELLGRK